MRTLVAASIVALSFAVAPVSNAEGIIGGVKRPLIQLTEGIIGGVKRPLIQADSPIQLTEGIIGGVKRPLIAAA